MNSGQTEKKWERVVDFSDRGERLDRFWGRELADEGVSRGRVKSWIEAGLALVDGTAVTKANHKLSGRERLELLAGPGRADETPEPDSAPLAALYEDAVVVVVDKPAALTTHPAPGEPDLTLVSRLLHRWPDMAAENSGMDPQRPGIVHRLDKDTSGLMVVARTEGARLALATDFAEHRVNKVYLALVHGRPERESGEVNAPMGRHPSIKTRMAVVSKGGREARSRWERLWTSPDGRASLLAVRIFTGRTHQIRVHLAHIGLPLLGDQVYGGMEHAELARRDPRLAELAARQMLHAFFLAFTHPSTGERLRFFLPPPDDFRAVLQDLDTRCMRVGITGMPGCGKSAFLRFLERDGHPVFSADREVAALYEPGADGAEMIRGRFGGIYSLPDNGVDKSALFKAMQESPGIRREVEAMVHPMVRHRCEAFFIAHAGADMAFAEVPLLVEGGWNKDGLVDMAVGPRCPADKRTGELRLARDLAPETLAAFDSWQWSEADKLAGCTLVVENSGGLDDLAREAETLIADIRTRTRERDAAFTTWLSGLWPDLAARCEQEDGQ